MAQEYYYCERFDGRRFVDRLDQNAFKDSAALAFRRLEEREGVTLSAPVYDFTSNAAVALASVIER